MKHNVIIVAASMLLLASCATNYVVTDHVGLRLDGTRTVLTADSTALDGTVYGRWQCTALGKPELFDFRTERDTMRHAFSQPLPSDGWTVADDSLPRLLRPQVNVSKHFRWFFTSYRYTAVFPAIDSLSVPIGQYLTSDEQHLLFQPLELPADWNGADMYALLDKLNTKYVKWLSHCLFEKEMAAYMACCDSAQQALLTQYHDTLLAMVFDSLPGEFRSIGNVATAFPELEFINKINSIGFDALKWAYENWDLDTRVLWRAELPGGRTTEQMVSTERLISGDYVVSAESRVLHWWAVALTLIPLLGLVVCLFNAARHNKRLSATL